MSLRGRYIIDRIKRVVSSHLKMPVPPYGDPRFWDNVYLKMEKATGADTMDTQQVEAMMDDTFEWGGIQLEDILQYTYKPVTIEQHPITGVYDSSSTTLSATLIETTFGETLGVLPHGNNNTNHQDSPKPTTTKEPILMLGCGNSQMGEHMIDHGWRGPLIQVDISETALQMLQRRSKYTAPRLQHVHEDATHLSSFRTNSIHATVDKGLLDAFFCADEYDQMTDICNSVLRVLQPGGIFCVFSFSRPEFILPRLLPPTPSRAYQQSSHQKAWHNWQVQELERIFLYRFQKSSSSSSSPSGFSEPKFRSKKRQ